MNSNYLKVLAIGLGVAVTSALGVSAQSTGANDKGIQQALRNQALGFRQNGGQWDARAKFLSQLPGLDYWVTADGIVIDQYQEGIDKGSYKPPTINEPYNKVAAFENMRRVGNVVEMHFVGANKGTGIEAAGPRAGAIDYFADKNHGARGVKSYSEAYVTQMYSGVHVRHYLQDQQIRYDIIVDPGHDPRQIEMSFKGTKGVNIEGGSKLSLATSVGKLNMADLRVYQPVGNAQKLVDARFVKTPNGTVKLEVGTYDPRLPLVIDPLIFGSYVGSNGLPLVNADEIVTAITAETNGNLYMTGVTSSVTFPINAGPYDKFNVQGIDAFLCQMDGNAYTIRYSAVLGGSGTDFGLGVGFEETSRALWIGGTTNSNNFAGATNANAGGSRAWVSKFIFATNGVTPVGMTYLNDPGQLTSANFRGLRVSKSGNVYIAGSSTVGNLTGLGYTNYLPNNPVAGKVAGFVVATDPSGTILYRTMIGGKVDCRINNLTVNANDEVVAVGYVDATNVEDTGVAPDPQFTTTSGVYAGVTGVFSGGRWLQNRTGYVLQLKNDGTGLWACTLGGAGQDDVRAVHVDKDDNVYVTGFTGSFNFQRTPGAFTQDFTTPQVYATKLTPGATEIQFSTGLGTTGVVFPTAISADGRGNVYVGGVCAFQINGGLAAAPSTPGSIITTARPGDPETAVDDEFNGGDTTVNGANIGDPDADLPSTSDGFITVLNPAGSALQYSSYIGEDSDDRVNDVFVDSVGGCWVAGYSQVVWNNFTLIPVPSALNGIGAHITANAFKTSMPTGIPGAAQPNYGASNGWVHKLRVVLPRLAGLGVAPTTVAGGFGAQSTVTVTIEDPAPAGGVFVTLTTSNASATSWDANASVLTTGLTIPEGATAASLPIYSVPVVSNQVSSIKVILDNDFKENRLTVLPWLSDMSLAPQVTQGGNDVVVTVNLADVAPAGGVPVLLSTDRPDIITLPQPSQILVPENAKNAQITVPTLGVATQTTATITASFLGVNKTKSVTLNPATLKDFTFSPSRVNRGDNSTGTVRLFGKTGGGRAVTITQVAGDPGVKVNGQTLPLVINIPDQTSQFNMTVTAPLSITLGFCTLKADDGVTSVQGTLNIDPIDILDLLLSPATDVTAGTVLTGQVRLTRPAGPGGLTVNLSSSNPNAGTLSDTQVTIPAGQTASSSFTFNTAIVSADTITNIHATKPGFADKYLKVTVRGIKMSLSLNPTEVIGFQQNSTGTVTLTKAAPPGGLKLDLTSSDTTVATVPDSVTVQEGQFSANFSVKTKRTPVQKTSTITAFGSAQVKDSKVLKVNPPAISSFTIDPTSVLGGTTAKGTIVLSTQAPAGTVITLTATPSGVVTIPATINVTSGIQTVSFLIKTNAVAATKNVSIKATLAPTSKTASLIVRSPGIGSVKFTPTRIVGGGKVLGTVTLDGPAPPGGVNVTITSASPNYAKPVTSVVHINAGALSANFQVTTNKVSRTVAVQFTATSSLGSSTGYLYVDP